MLWLRSLYLVIAVVCCELLFILVAGGVVVVLWLYVLVIVGGYFGLFTCLCLLCVMLMFVCLFI